jgi:hypothetical protein
MRPDCFAEQSRLQARTIALSKRTSELATPGRPFSQAEHDDLTAQLAAHKADLAAFKARCLGRVSA